MLVKEIFIETDYRWVYIYRNTKKPWWKKRPISFCGPYSFWHREFLDSKVEIQDFFIRFNGNGKLLPLKDNSVYR